MRVAAVVSDLMTFSRIDSAVAQAGGSLRRVTSPSELPPPEDVDLVLVDWDARGAGWPEALTSWLPETHGPRLVLFGPHVDLDAHADARAAGLGPMWARSRLMRELPALVSDG